MAQQPSPPPTTTTTQQHQFKKGKKKKKTPNYIHIPQAVFETMPPIQLPVIDISKATPEAGKALVDAAIKYGFLYVDSASCGIPLNDVEAMFGMVSRRLHQIISYHIISYPWILYKNTHMSININTAGEIAGYIVLFSSGRNAGIGCLSSNRLVLTSSRGNSSPRRTRRRRKLRLGIMYARYTSIHPFCSVTILGNVWLTHG